MNRLCTGLFLWLAFSLSAAAGRVPETGHDEVVYYADAYAAHYADSERAGPRTHHPGVRVESKSSVLKGRHGADAADAGYRGWTMACTTLSIFQKTSPAGFNTWPI